MQNEKQTLNLSVVSDLICPWCFIAKRKIDQLKTHRPDVEFNVEWKPFQLNPTMPTQGMDRKQYRSAKFGSWERSQALDAHVHEAGEEIGIEFRHDLMQKTPNTSIGHKLIFIAGLEGKQDEVVESLFRAYFCEGKDIGDVSVLVEIARGAGLASDKVALQLADTKISELVKAEEIKFQSYNLRSVPTFIVDGKILPSGVQPDEFLNYSAVVNSGATGRREIEYHG